MEPIDILIKNGWVLTMDPQDTLIERGAVAVSADRIVEVGTEDALTASYKAAKTIDAQEGIIMPGLVNAHTHAAMTCFRGLADDLPLMTWLNDYIFPAEAKLTPDIVYQGTRLACSEMILSGTTTFCDMYLFEEAAAQAAKEVGLRTSAAVTAAAPRRWHSQATSMATFPAPRISTSLPARSKEFDPAFRERRK